MTTEFEVPARRSADRMYKLAKARSESPGETEMPCDTPEKFHWPLNLPKIFAEEWLNGELVPQWKALLVSSGSLPRFSIMSISPSLGKGYWATSGNSQIAGQVPLVVGIFARTSHRPYCCEVVLITWPER